MGSPAPLRILVVEDEALLAAELELLIEDAGHQPVGVAASAREAIDLAARLRPDLAFVDVHLADGPTGIELARRLAAQVVVVFITANAKRIPEDFAGASGLIGKPYTESGVRAALRFLAACLRDGTAPAAAPGSIVLAPAFRERWRVAAGPGGR